MFLRRMKAKRVANERAKQNNLEVKKQIVEDHDDSLIIDYSNDCNSDNDSCGSSD